MQFCFGRTTGWFNPRRSRAVYVGCRSNIGAADIGRPLFCLSEGRLGECWCIIRYLLWKQPAHLSPCSRGFRLYPHALAKQEAHFTLQNCFFSFAMSNLLTKLSSFPDFHHKQSDADKWWRRFIFFAITGKRWRWRFSHLPNYLRWERRTITAPSSSLSSTMATTNSRGSIHICMCYNYMYMC